MSRSAGVGAEIDFKWLQGIGGKNTSNGSTFFLTYNHVFKPASK